MLERLHAIYRLPLALFAVRSSDLGVLFHERQRISTVESGRLVGRTVGLFTVEGDLAWTSLRKHAIANCLRLIGETGKDELALVDVSKALVQFAWLLLPVIDWQFNPLKEARRCTG